MAKRVYMGDAITKADLIRLLEPFTDEIKIRMFTANDDAVYMYEVPEVCYETADKDDNQCMRGGIEDKEAFILLMEPRR